MQAYQYELKTKAGSIWLLATSKGLCGVNWEAQAHHSVVNTLRAGIPAHNALRESSRQLTEYFSGARRSFDLDLDISGTPFQESVWNALKTIPFGTTLSYKELAAKIQNPKAVRAVGSANGRNPVCIVIPCHRVIAADGTLGGYTGGLANKVRLLNVEAGLR